MLDKQDSLPTGLACESAGPAQGLLFVLSAPSGAGKTTLGTMLLDQLEGLQLSISYTTRQMRPGEQDGHDYHFVPEQRFRSMIDNAEFVEWARVHDNYYGTALADIEKLCDQGRDVLLDIDVQGAAQLRDKGIPAVFIFIAPPSFEALEQRLRRRDSDDATTIEKRIKNARTELEQARLYDYIVINDDLSDAAAKLHAIISAEHGRTQMMLPALRYLGLVKQQA